MDKPKKKHHFVPKSHLAGFTKKESVDSILWVFDQETGEQRESKPNSEGFEKYLYKVELPDVPHDALEDTFMHVEAKTAPIIKNVRSTLEMPTGNDFIWLMNYVALQFARTPSRIEAVSKPMEKIAKTVMQMSVSTREWYEKMIQDLKKAGREISDDLSYEEIQDFVMNEDRYVVTVDNNTKLNNMLTVIDAIIPTLINRQWSVLCCPPTVGDFICSDNPVSLHWTNGQLRNGIFDSPGHGLPNTEVSIPLSSRVMLIGRFNNHQPSSGIVPNKRMLAALNSFTGMYSSRFIFTRKKDFYWLSNENKIANVDDFRRMIKKRELKNNN
jgi:hypothetical protein